MWERLGLELKVKRFGLVSVKYGLDSVSENAGMSRSRTDGPDLSGSPNLVL